MDKTPDFKHPVHWQEIADRLLAVVPEEHHGTIMLIAGALQHRDEALEDFLSFEPEVITFHHDDTVTADTSSGKPIRRGGRVESIEVTAEAVASGSSTFRLYVDGVQIGADFTLPASEPAGAVYSVDVSSFRYEYVERNSKLAIESVTVGSGLGGVVVDVTLRG